MKPLTNQRRQTPAASPAQSLHRASQPHAEIGEETCNLCEFFFAAPNRLASYRKKSTELDPSDFHVKHFSVFAQPLTKNAPPTLTAALK
jgi:hypothetical protein